MLVFSNMQEGFWGVKFVSNILQPFRKNVSWFLNMVEEEFNSANFI